MATRGTALSRALAFFRDEQDLDVVRVAFLRAKEIVESRLNATAQSKLPFKKRVRQVNKAATAQVKADAGNETLGNA